MRFIIFAIILSLLACAGSAAIENPRTVTDMDVKVIQTGTLDITGSIERMNLTLYVPQENAEFIEIDAEKWKFVSDEFGNRLLLLEWDGPERRVEYRVESIVRNKASFLSTEKGIGSDPGFLRETASIQFSSEINEIAFPFEKSFRRAAEMTYFVNEYLEYDLSVVGQRKSSVWALENKRGVCVEFSNLAAAMMRSAGIPTRYVVGYAYSGVEDKIIGHTWLEILADDGEWIGFDPTWNQAGYIDATHIKTGVLLDDSQKDTLTYVGHGSIDWTRNDDIFQIIGYISKNLTEITIDSKKTFATNEYGFINAKIKPSTCGIVDISINSCTDANGDPLLDIFERRRNIWACEETGIYWFFDVNAPEGGYVYRCPVSIYDQGGSVEVIEITLSGERPNPEISISGPDTAGINEEFTLRAETNRKDLLFYSSEFGESSSKEWALSIGKPGEYKFYLYVTGSLAEKTINIVEEKEFTIEINNPSNVTSGSSFMVAAEIRNLLDENKDATIRLEFDDNNYYEELSFKPREKLSASFNLSSESVGLKRIGISAISDSISSYSSYINVYYSDSEGELISTDFLGGIISAISKLFTDVISAIRNLF